MTIVQLMAAMRRAEMKKKEEKKRRIKDMRNEECVLTGEGTLNVKTDR